MSELSRRGAQLLEDPALAAPPVRVVQDRARRYRLRRRARAAVAACALAAAVVGGVAWHAAGPAPRPQRWAAAGPAGMLSAPAVAAVPAGSAPARGAPGTWRLAGDISLPLSWNRSNGGPAPGYLSCPQAGTCYLAGSAGGGSSSGPGPSLDVLYVSHDGGLSWAAVRMAGGASFTTALACPDAGGACLAGGEIAGQPVLLATGDGGLHWTYRALPAGDGVINQLTCPTLQSCRALATQTAQPYWSGSTTPHAWFLWTDDAGARWGAETFPARDTIGALSCPSAAECVAVGSGAGRASADGEPPGAVLRTVDGGRTWSRGALPPGMSVLPFADSSVTCAGTSICYALGDHPQRYHPTDTAQGEICVSNGSAGCVPPAYVEGGAVAVSSDGGATWRMLALPPRTPQPDLSDISCATALDCWIAGEQAVPQVVGKTYNGASAMILATTDGGATWSKITFAATRLPGGEQGDSLMDVGEIACPAVNSCVGIGAVDQGSYHVPVYTNAGS